MSRAVPVLPGNEHVRGLLGLVAVVAVLLALTEMTVLDVAPMVVLLGGMLAVDVLKHRFDLPDGTDRVGLGLLVCALAATFAAVSRPAFAAVLGTIGAWITIDGYTTARAPDQPTHEFVAGTDDDAAEVMLRMQTLNVVNQALKDSDGPRTVPGLAADLDLTESRVERALSFLAEKGHAEKTPDGYRATPPRWGRLYPVVAFARWLPRRLARPFVRLARDSRPDEK